ncbi:MAG: addiction module protein [Fimbriiglobus sp.]
MTTLSIELQNLSVDERIALWDSIPQHEHPPLSDARKAELERRIAEDDADPDSAIPWEEVHARILARLDRKESHSQASGMA